VDALTGSYVWFGLANVSPCTVGCYSGNGAEQAEYDILLAKELTVVAALTAALAAMEYCAIRGLTTRLASD
jgi:hypothetical protein